jgi:outer membrane biosynthesis protein TonB
MKQKWTSTFVVVLCIFLSCFLFLFYSRKTVIAAAENKTTQAKKDVQHELEQSTIRKEATNYKKPVSSTNTSWKTPLKTPVSLEHVAAGFSGFANNYKQKKQENSEISLSETRFLEKILQSIATMRNIYRNKLAPYAHEQTAVHCAVSLSKNGLIEQCAISKTSGNIMLDSLIKQIISEAGASFPPLPKSIEKIPYYLIFQFDFDARMSLKILLPK